MCMYVLVEVFVPTCVVMWSYVSLCVYVRVGVFTHLRTYVCVLVCMYVFIYVFMYVCLYLSFSYV